MKWMSTPGRKREVKDEEIIAAIKSVEAPFANTMDVAERTGLGRQGALQRLQKLEKAGVIGSKQSGSGYGWWVR